MSISKEEIIEKERIVVSSILFNKECREYATHEGVNEDYFQPKSTLRKIIQAFNAISIDGTEPTESLIIDHLIPNSKEKRSKVALYLKQLKDESPPESLEALHIHLRILKNLFTKNKHTNLAKEILDLASKKTIKDLSYDEDDIGNLIEGSLFDMADENAKEGEQLMDIIEGYHYTVQHMREKMASKENDTVTSGYSDLDRILSGGFRKGTFSLIAARPGMGKTVWMLNSAVESAKAGSKVLFISIEMNLLQCFQRILSKISTVEGGKLQQPDTMNHDDWKKLEEAGKNIIDLYEETFWIKEITALTVSHLERMIKQYKKRFGIDIVYIDYAQIMLTKTGEEPKDPSDFAEISGALRRVSKSQNVAVVVGSQLNRKAEERNDKRPIMADIRNSGAFEQDAAQIIALYRDDHYNPKDSEKPNIIELIFLKNRFGKAAVNLDYFYDLSRQSILTFSPS